MRSHGDTVGGGDGQSDRDAVVGIVEFVPCADHTMNAESKATEVHGPTCSNFPVATVSKAGIVVIDSNTYIEADQLVDTLFDPGTEWARKPLALTADSVSRGRNSCFGGWLSGSDPVHVVVISARDDVSGRTPGTWVSQMRSE